MFFTKLLVSVVLGCAAACIVAMEGRNPLYGAGFGLIVFIVLLFINEDGGGSGGEWEKTGEFYTIRKYDVYEKKDD